MPTFFSKILNLGKDKDKKGDSGTKEPQSPTSPKSGKRHSIHSLLEGKFEAVSPTVSEQGENVGKEQDVKGTAESESDKEKDKLVTLLSRPKARTKSPTRRSDDFPRLTLNLTLPSVGEGEKRSGARELRTVLEGTVDGAPLLDEATIGKTRLSPPEALKLMKACAGVINERGLDTLGVMHPHWHSASPQLQRRLISLFMASIGQSASPKAQSVFEDGMEFTRSSHDIASVFRWALRHLQLEGHSFASAKNVEASAAGPLSWYGSFVDDERTGGYPQSAFSSILLPTVKAPHVDLLLVTADLMSVLAAHSEANGVSGSKLSMILGQYLLIGSQETGEIGWKEFYERWENSGRALEHIFLCYLREETSKGKIPKRVQELVAGYPFAKHAIEGNSRFPRPARFATRSIDALHVLITCEVPQQSKLREDNAYPPPLSVIENALKSDAPDDAKELEQTWNRIKTLANTKSEGDEVLEGKAEDQRNLLSRVLSDESIRLLGLRPDDTERVNKGTPTITMFSHVPGEARVYSKSYSSNSNGSDVPNGKGKESLNGISRNASEATATSTTLGGPTPISPIASDWTAFSSSGFGEDALGSSLASTLMDSDVEKTQPAALESRRSLKKSGSRGHKGERAKSRERVGRKTNVTPLAASEPPASESIPSVASWKTSSVSIVKLDEAFVDFWADALLDPIARPWPTFVVCQLKSNVNVEVEEGRKVNWLVVEQAFVSPPPPPPQVEEEHPAQRASSPKPSVASDTKRPGPVGRVSSTFKRFALFGSGTSYSDEKEVSKKSGKGIRVGEMGEIIHEEPTSPPMSPVPTASNKEEKKQASALKEGPSDKEVAAAAAIAVGGVAVASALDQVAESLKPEPESKVETAEPSKDEAVPEQPVLQSTVPEPTKVAEKQAETATTEEPVSIPPAEPEANVEEAAEQVSAPEVVEQPAAVDATGLSKEQELAEEAATKALSDAPVPVTETVAEAEVEKREDASQPEREVVGDNSAGETTEAQALESTVEPPRPRSPGAGDSRFVEHLDSTPDIAEHAAPLEAVDEATEKIDTEEAEEVVGPAEVASVLEPAADEKTETEVKEAVTETVETPEVPTESSVESPEQHQAVEETPEVPIVEEAVTEEPVQESVAVPEAPVPEQVIEESPAAEGPIVEAVAEPETPAADPVDVSSVAEPLTEEPLAADEPSSLEPTSEAHVVEEPSAQEATIEEPVATIEEHPVESSVADEPEAVVPASEVPEPEELSVPEASSTELAEATPAELVAEVETSEPAAQIVPSEAPVDTVPETTPSAAEDLTAPNDELPAQEVSTAEGEVAEVADTMQAEVVDAEVSKSAEEVSVVEEPIAEAPAKEESVAEVPATEEPAAEQLVVEAEPPVTEEAVIEALIVEEPAVEAQIPPATTIEEETAVESQQIAEEPSPEEPTVEETPVAEPTAEAPEEPVSEESIVTESVTEAPIPAESAPEPQVAEESVSEPLESHAEAQPASEEPIAETTLHEQVETEPAVAEEPVIEASVVAEAPVAEEPAVEEPIAEEVVAESPAINETTEVPVAEEPAVEEPVSEVSATSETTTEVPVIEEPVVETPAEAEEEAEEAAPSAEDAPIIEHVVDESSAEEPPVESAVVEDPPADPVQGSTHATVADEHAVEEHADEPSAHAEPEIAEAVEAEVPAERVPQLSAEESAAPESDAPAVTETPEDTTHSLEKSESAPELDQPSPPVVSGEVETTVHHEEPIVENITTGPDASANSEDKAESAASAAPPTTDEQPEPTGATQSSEHLESEPAPAENGAPAEVAKESSDEVPPVDGAETQPSEPAVVDPSNEPVPDEAQSS